MSITLAQICDAIEGTLSTALPATGRSQSYDELTEGINDIPTLQVYPESGRQDAITGNAQHSFGGNIRVSEIIIHADYYASQRRHLSEDMKRMVDGIDLITNVLEAQKNTGEFFGLDGIKSFGPWSWSRVTFVYGDNSQPYIGVRFVIPVRVF